MWVVLYREGRSRRYHTLGLYSKMSKSDAQVKQAEVMAEINARQACAPDPDITFGNFLEGVALPHLRSKWKRSTASTTESRIRHHLLAEFKDTKLQSLGLKGLQAFLTTKAASLSRSVVAHLRWDLRSIFKIAVAEGYIERDPTGALFTPKEARAGAKRVMTREEVHQHIHALEMRERVIAHLALFAGMRPGEILGLQRRHVADGCRKVVIEQRIYRGDLDTPKTNTSSRTVAIGTKTAFLMQEWMRAVGDYPEAWVFASENPSKPVWRDNIWYRHMKPRLEMVGLGWANFQVMRRTHASLGHDAGIDPKVSADQRGHGIGVAIDVYTRAGLKKRAEAAETLENAVLTA
ncbi:MAG TPA: tyrosine-type recombinase/integrase [Bryobacteraceae bacterium]|nr:tyrosine-type recombinase/integrase [Bryobacteraceae bacterium]